MSPDYVAHPQNLRSKMPEVFANYLRHHKQQELGELGKTIRDGTISDAERDHALKSLSHITGRKFHWEDNPHKKAV